MNKVKEVLNRPQKAGLKVNASKSFFACTKPDHLGHWITREGIKPLPDKVAAIMHMAEPKTKKELRSFIGLINYHRDVWIRRSDILVPLAKLTGKNSTWQQTDIESKVFATVE